MPPSKKTKSLVINILCIMIIICIIVFLFYGYRCWGCVHFRQPITESINIPKIIIKKNHNQFEHPVYRDFNN